MGSFRNHLKRPGLEYRKSAHFVCAHKLLVSCTVWSHTCYAAAHKLYNFMSFWFSVVLVLLLSVLQWLPPWSCKLRQGPFSFHNMVAHEASADFDLWRMPDSEL